MPYTPILATLGYVLWIPPFGWEVGYFFWGYLVDKLGPRFRGLMFASLVLSLPLAWMHSLPSGTLVLGDMFLTMFGLAGFVVLDQSLSARALGGIALVVIASVGASVGASRSSRRAPIDV